MDLGSWKVTEEWTQRYLRAVGDDRPEYSDSGLAPPLGLAAWALGSLLERLDLPPGAIHSLQELETLSPVRLGDQISATASIGRPKRRGDMGFIAAGYTMENEAGRPVVRGKSTVLVIHPGSPTSAGRKSPQPNSPSSKGKAVSLDGRLPAVVKTITQSRLHDYSCVSGDHNPLHLDAKFAAGTQFRGIIAHGMLTLALIAEMMLASFGRSWMDSGSLRVKFKGAAHLEDELETWGQVTKEEPHASGRRIVCSVGLRNRRSGQDLIDGTATVGRTRREL